MNTSNYKISLQTSLVVALSQWKTGLQNSQIENYMSLDELK